MAPGDRGLVVEVAAGLLGGLVDRRPVLGEQRLVGGHDAGAVLQRGEDQRPGRLDAADDLDDDVHVVAGDQRGRVGGEQPLGHLDLAGRVEAAYGDADQLDRLADPRLEVTGLLLQEADHLRADRAAAEDGHLDAHCSHFRHTHVRRQQVVLSLAPQQHPRDPVPHGDHRRPQGVVVVGGHRPAVGAGARHRDQVARSQVAGQELVADHDVTGLAVLAHDPRQDRRRRSRRGWRSCRSSRRRRARCGRCRSSRRRPRRRCGPRRRRARPA